MRAIISFQGFTETNKYRTGTEDLYFNVIRKFSSDGVTTYQPQSWTSNVKSVVRQLSRQGINDVALISYSHGQAAGAAFAKYAKKYNIEISLWLCCDPVYRSKFIPRYNVFQIFSAWSLTKWATVKVPANIHRVIYVKQDYGIPCGHDMIAEDEANTYVKHDATLNETHQTIDHCAYWFNLVSAELKDWIIPKHAREICINTNSDGS